MSEHLKKAEELRAIVTPHYNCAQSVLVPFAKDCGLTEAQAYKVGACFGAGMKSGYVCGAVTGCLMVLGMLDKNENELTQKVLADFKARHQGCLNCTELLKVNEDAGKPKKPHCDGLVYEMIKEIEKILAE